MRSLHGEELQQYYHTPNGKYNWYGIMLNRFCVKHDVIFGCNQIFIMRCGQLQRMQGHWTMHVIHMLC